MTVQGLQPGLDSKSLAVFRPVLLHQHIRGLRTPDRLQLLQVALLDTAERILGRRDRSFELHPKLNGADFQQIPV